MPTPKSADLESTETQAEVAEIQAPDSKAAYERYLFALVLAQFAGRGTPANIAAEVSLEYAKAGAALYYPD